MTGANEMPAPGEERMSVSGVITPKKPIRKPPRSMMRVAARPPAGVPSAPSTLAPSQGKAEAAKFRAATSGPKSYSWLPTTAMSVPMAFIISTIWVPWVRPDMTDGEKRSPPKVVTERGDAARSRSRRVMRGAKPPLPRFGAIS